MRQLAQIIHDSSAASQPHNPATAQPQTTTPRRPASSTCKFPFPSYRYAKYRLAAGGTWTATDKGASDLFEEVKHLARRTANGVVRTTTMHLRRATGVKSRTTVWRRLTRLAEVGLISPPGFTKGPRGYVNGLVFIVRLDPACVHGGEQQELPLKSRNTKSSAAPAPSPPAKKPEATKRPPDPATWGHVVKAAWEVTNGETVPDNLPDIAAAVLAQLVAWDMTAPEVLIRRALDHVERERRWRQRALPLLGVARRMPASPGQTRQEPARATNGVGGGVDVGVPHAVAPAARTQAPVTAELPAVAEVELARRRGLAQQLDGDISAAVDALPPVTYATLGALVRPQVDDLLRRCPAISPRERPRLERACLVERVRDELRGRAPDDTIAALVAESARFARCG